MSARRRWIAGLAGLSLVAGVLLVPSSETTDAAWTDAEYTATSFTAFRLVPPQISSRTCVHPLSVALGGTVLEILWRWPSTDAPYSDPTKMTDLWTVDGVITPSVPPTTGPIAGVYTTKFTRGILQGVLGTISALLGGSFTVAGKADWTVAVGRHWISPESSSVTVTYPVLGLGSTTCPFHNGS